MSPINSLWFKWKSIKLPWRNTFFIGTDLQGNSFWEFKDALNSQRMRRIVKANPSVHHADVKVSPQWSQWLRHVREAAPSIEEQQNDLIRQQRLKQLARIADDKWNAKKSYIGPARQSTPANSGTGTKPEEGPVMAKLKESSQRGSMQQEAEAPPKPNPWADADRRAQYSDRDQPEAWTPPTLNKR